MESSVPREFAANPIGAALALCGAGTAVVGERLDRSICRSGSGADSRAIVSSSEARWRLCC